MSSPRTRLRPNPLLLSVAALLLSSAAGAMAQAPPPGWNDVRVLRLIERAREQRRALVVDPKLTSYQARAIGHVYFFVERPDSGTNVLMKGDQVALDVYWRAPDETKQWIVGRRDERVLPTSIRYHLDHLTIVQDDFGDFIRLGDGDEVEAVVHPVAPAAESIYDYRLTDSLSLSYAGGQEEVRVYEIGVRPKSLDRPGYVGTIFIDRRTAAIVRMNFSFTPASYVDPYLDYIRISLDNALWLGRHWLPYRQEVELRREIPFLDFMAGSTIRSTFDVRDYDFNVELQDYLFAGTGVRSLSPAQRRAFTFDQDIFEELEASGGPGPSLKMEEVRQEVREVVEDEVLSGLSGLRLHAARISDFARYNRAEGIYAGAGLTFRPYRDLQLRATGGYAFGAERAVGSLTLTRQGEGIVPTLVLSWDELGDIGGHPGATPLENTISTASGDKDFLDPFVRRGGSLTLSRRPSEPWSLSVAVERHRSARDVISEPPPDSGLRPVRSVEEGTVATLTARVRSGLPGGGRADWAATGGLLNERTFGSIGLEAAWTLHDEAERWSGYIQANGALTNSGAPPQLLHAIGGRHTLPGHDYRAFTGNAYWLVRLEGTVPIVAPYVSLRAFTALGATYLRGVTLPSDWVVSDSGGLRGSAGLGVAFGWDAMRLDVGRALWGRGWEAVFSVAPQFRSWL